MELSRYLDKKPKKEIKNINLVDRISFDNQLDKIQRYKIKIRNNIKSIMKKKKGRKSKGFGKSSGKKYSQYEVKYGRELKRILDLCDSKVNQALEKVDITTRRNQLHPSALEDFKELVKEGNKDKLADYFKQYGIDPVMAKFNLEKLIAEELRDLSN